MSVILITGTSSGIGLDTPVHFARKRHDVYAAVRNPTTAGALAGMRARGSGVIVNVSSVAGRYVPAGHGHYAAVKHALEAASEALALEVTPLGLRVVIIEPGVIVTPIFSKAKRFVAPDSPYAHHLRRLLLMYQRQLTNPTPPERVAETIEEAVTTPTPRLRWLVGDDAQRLVAGRMRSSDEEFVADASAATDAEWEALMRRRYGFEWP